jgi:hypothetical protein
MEIVIIAVSVQLIDIVLYAQVPWSQKRVIPWFVRWLPLSGFFMYYRARKKSSEGAKTIG